MANDLIIISNYLNQIKELLYKISYNNKLNNNNILLYGFIILLLFTFSKYILFIGILLIIYLLNKNDNSSLNNVDINININDINDIKNKIGIIDPKLIEKAEWLENIRKLKSRRRMNGMKYTALNGSNEIDDIRIIEIEKKIKDEGYNLAYFWLYSPVFINILTNNQSLWSSNAYSYYNIVNKIYQLILMQYYATHMGMKDFGLLYKDAYGIYKSIMNDYASFVFKIGDNTMDDTKYSNLQEEIQSNIIKILNNIYMSVTKKEQIMGPNAYTPDTQSYNINYSTDGYGYSFNNQSEKKLYY